MSGEFMSLHDKQVSQEEDKQDVNVKMMYLGECGVGHPLNFSYVHKKEA